MSRTGDGPVRIRLLGDVAVDGAAGEERPQGQQARVALAFLTANRHRPVTKEELADAVWPERVPTTWDAALRGVVSKTRAMLDRAGLRGDHALTADGGCYHLRLPSTTSVDADVALAALEAAEDALEHDDPASAGPLAQQAAAALEDPLLPGVDGPWLDALRAKLSMARLRALDAAARAALAGGDAPTALLAAEAAVAVDAFRESSHRLVMSAHAAAGSRSEALRAYERCRSTLAEELGIRPSAETEALYVSLLGDEPDRIGEQPDQDWVRVPPRLQMGATPFAGRTEEARILDGVVASGATGAGRIVLVLGDAGIGKTRLCAQLATTAVAAGAVVAYGRSDRDLGLPYQPFVEAFTSLLEAMPQDLIESYARTFGGALSRLAPVLARRVPTASMPTVSPETERHVVFDAARGLVKHVGSPLVLVVDDLHWADRPTLQLFRYLADAAPDLPLVLVGVLREWEVDLGSPLHDLLARLRRLDHSDVVQLAGLGDADIAELVSAVADEGGDAGAAVARRLTEETGGNPLYATELLRHLVETEALQDWAARGTAPLELPETVRDLVVHRVAKLGPGATEVLCAASVIGHDFELSVLQAALRAPEDEVLEALDAAEAVHLLGPAATPGRFAFSHVLVADALRQTLGASRRGRLHVRIADAIEADARGQVATRSGELAAHLLAAGPIADPARVLGATCAAGHHALTQLAPDEAVRWYTAALERVPEDDRALRSDVLTGLGIGQQQAGIPAFRETLLEASYLAMELGDDGRLMTAALANNRGDRAKTYFVDRERVAVLEAVVERAGPDDSAELLAALALLALETAHDPDWALRLSRSDASLAMARRLGDAATLANVLRMRNEATRLPDTLATRRDETAELVAVAEQLGDAMQLAYGNAWRARAAIEGGNLELHDRCIAHAWDLTAKVPLPFLRWSVSAAFSYRAIISGDLAGAEQKAHECLALAEEAGEPDGRMVFGDQLVTIRDAQGRLDEVESLVRRAVERYPHVRGMRAMLAYVLSEIGHADEATRLLDEDAQGAFAGFTRDLTWAPFVFYAARAAANLGRVPAAEVLYELLEPWDDQVVWTGSTVHGPVALGLGQLALVLGRTDDARRHLDHAVQVATDFDAPLWLARARLAQATTSSRAEALELARTHGFAGVERACSG